MINNGVELQNMIFNGQEVKTWILNDVEVYVSARPFYWIRDNKVQDGFLTTYANYELSPYNASFIPNLATLGFAGESSNRTFKGETELINTQGNKYIEIVFYEVGVTDSTSKNGGILNSFKVAGVEYKDLVTESAVITIDVSNLDTVSIYTDLTAWEQDNWAQLYIKSIRFYSDDNSITILIQPENQTVTLNNYATFSVEAMGNNLSYQWQWRNAYNDWANSGMTGANTNTISVQGTSARNGYQYRCVITDARGNQVITDAAKLTVRS